MYTETLSCNPHIILSTKWKNFHIFSSSYTDDNDYLGIQDSILEFQAVSPEGTIVCLDISILDEDVVEPEQQFIVQLSSMDPVNIGPNGTATVINVDSDGEYCTFFFSISRKNILQRHSLFGERGGGEYATCIVENKSISSLKC